MQTIKPKLIKLIPLLGSPQANEAAAAARAMTRMLASVKCDWHDIVKIIENSNSQPEFKRPPPKSKTTDGRWRMSQKGNWWRKIAGGDGNMTVFRSNSQYRNGDWSVVIIIDDDKTYLNDFDSIEEAKAAEEAYLEENGIDSSDTPF